MSVTTVPFVNVRVPFEKSAEVNAFPLPIILIFQPPVPEFPLSFFPYALMKLSENSPTLHFKFPSDYISNNPSQILLSNLASRRADKPTMFAYNYLLDIERFILPLVVLSPFMVISPVCPAKVLI